MTKIRRTWEEDADVKGTVSRDLFLPVFFMNQFPPSHDTGGKLPPVSGGGKFATGVNDTRWQIMGTISGW
jgi:hypothetical protein